MASMGRNMAWGASRVGVGPGSWVVARAGPSPVGDPVSTVVCGLARVCLVALVSLALKRLGRASAWLWLAWWRYLTSRRLWSVRWGRLGGLQFLVHHFRQVKLDSLQEFLELAVTLPPLICLVARVFHLRGHWHKHLYHIDIWCHLLPLGLWWHFWVFWSGCAPTMIRRALSLRFRTVFHGGTRGPFRAGFVGLALITGPCT